jgi:hypothetical protein
VYLTILCGYADGSESCLGKPPMLGRAQYWLIVCRIFIMSSYVLRVTSHCQFRTYFTLCPQIYFCRGPRNVLNRVWAACWMKARDVSHTHHYKPVYVPIIMFTHCSTETLQPSVLFYTIRQSSNLINNNRLFPLCSSASSIGRFFVHNLIYWSAAICS